MRLTLSALGFELDLSFGPASDEDTAVEGADLSGGTLGSIGPVTTVGFTTPEDVPLPQRTPAWDEPEERRR